MLKSTRALILTCVLVAASLGMLTGAIMGIHLRPDPPRRSQIIDLQIDGEWVCWEVYIDPDTGRWSIRRVPKK